MKTVTIAFSLLISTASAFIVTINSPTARNTRLQLGYRTIEDAIREAEDICAEDPQCEECRVAWDIVRELDFEQARGLSPEVGYGPRNGYSLPPPEEDVRELVRDFDMLAVRLDDKLNRLMATTDRLLNAGATDPAVDELGHRAEEMKMLLARVSRYLDQA